MDVKKILDVACSQIGITESPPGSNRQKYGVWYGMNGAPWCAMFCSWVFEKAGCPLPKIQTGAPSGAAYCPYIEQYARKYRQWQHTPRPGDLALFSFGKNLAVHIGIVETVQGDKFTCIEGNTGVDNDANGGAVMRRNRRISQCRGFYRPSVMKIQHTGKNAYYRLIRLTSPYMEGNDIKEWQKQMRYFTNYQHLEVDGIYGPESEAACRDLQAKRALDVDGIIGPNTWAESFQRD